MRKTRRNSSLSTTRFLVVLAIGCVALGVLLFIGRLSTDDAADSTEGDIVRAMECGTSAAMRAAEQPSGTMGREKAILDIRAFESEIRRAGFPTAADSFAVAAERVLRSHDVLR